MKAMVLTGIREMELREVPDPAMSKDTDLLLRVEAVGVCGSDVHYYKTGRIGSQQVQYPFTVGHELGATVVDVGSAVTGFSSGDRVSVDPAISCGRCDQCLTGRENTCRNLRFLGCPGQADGCLSELLVMPEACCYRIGEEMTFAQAVIVEPLAIGVYAAAYVPQMTGARIGILGCGAIGLSVLLPALGRNVGKVYVTDKIDARLEAAGRAVQSHAGDSVSIWTGNPDKEDVVAAITREEPLLLDAVFECSGDQDAMDQAVDILRPGGKLMLIGIPEADRVSFQIDSLRRKELHIQNVRRQNECVRETIDMIESGVVNVDFMITHHFALDEAKEAFDLVDSYADGVIRAIITP